MGMMRGYGCGPSVRPDAEATVARIHPDTRQSGGFESLGVDARSLMNGTIDLLGNVLAASNVLVVFLPSIEEIDVRISSPAVVAPAMVYLTSLCCQLLGREGGSLDLGATLRNKVVDITLEPLPRPQCGLLPPQFDEVRRAMESVGNRVSLHESKDRLYFAVSLPVPDSYRRY